MLKSDKKLIYVEIGQKACSLKEENTQEIPVATDNKLCVSTPILQK
jgi:hypothetical protein